jgi:LPXTG-motif cell wall-anchored protein
MKVHVSSRRRVAGGLAAVAAGAIALAGAFPGTAGATGATGGGGHPEHPCPDEGWDFHWGPDNQHQVPGTHTDGDFEVTISNVRTENERRTFDFETSVPIELLFAVGYPSRDDGETFDYDPPVSEGTAFTGDPEYIKHVYFCPAPPPPTSTSTSSTSSSSTSSSSTSTSTSTVPPTSGPTVTPPSSVEPTTPPPTEAPTTAPPTTQPIGEELPRTGNNTMPLVAGAGALIAAGAAAVAGRRYLQNRA